MADRVLLRRLTFKSKLGFGKDEDLTVKEAIELEKEKQLIDAYYNFSKITFSDDVLDKLGIAEGNRIDKPGKNEDLGREIIKAMRLMELIEERKRRDKLIAKEHLLN